MPSGNCFQAAVDRIVLPDQIAISTAHEAFDESGQLKDARKAGQVAELVRGLVAFLAKHKAA